MPKKYTIAISDKLFLKGPENMSKIVLNNGAEIMNGNITEVAWSTGSVFVTFPGSNIVNATILFGNPVNSEKMECYNSIYKDTYYGYTVIENISMSADGSCVELWMKGTEGSHHEREYTVSEDFTPEEIVRRYQESEERNKNQNGPENDTAGEN